MATFTLNPTVYNAVQFNSVADLQALLDIGAPVTNGRVTLQLFTDSGHVPLRPGIWVVRCPALDGSATFKLIPDAIFTARFTATP